MCELRDYQPGDEASVLQLLQQCLAEYRLQPNPATTDADLHDIERSYLHCGGAFRILDRDGAIAGTCGLFPTSRRSCELRKMYLLPELKGRGLGRRLMDDALRVARRLGFEEMTLETNSRLREALGSYREFGFVEFTPLHLADRCDLAMRRAL